MAGFRAPEPRKSRRADVSWPYGHHSEIGNPGLYTQPPPRHESLFVAQSSGSGAVSSARADVRPGEWGLLVTPPPAPRNIRRRRLSRNRHRVAHPDAPAHAQSRPTRTDEAGQHSSSADSPRPFPPSALVPRDQWRARRSEPMLIQSVRPARWWRTVSRRPVPDRPPRRPGRELRGVRGGWRSPRRVASPRIGLA